MKKYLLPQNTGIYKANLHCHSTWSDGDFSPEQLKALYKEKGYSVLCITDHEGLFSHYDLDDGEFITLTGYELAFDELRGPSYRHTLTTHVCAIAKDKENFRQPGFDPDWRFPSVRWSCDDEKRALIRPVGEPFDRAHAPENVNKALGLLKENGFLLTHNHIAWSLENYTDYMALSGMDFIEIYNHGCYVEGYDEHNPRAYDDLLRSGRRMGVVAADDTHRSRDMFGGFNMIYAEKLEYASIIKALEAGNSYASTGPEFDEVSFCDGVFRVTSRSPVEHIRIVTGYRYAGCSGGVDCPRVSSCELKITPECRYVRAELVDGQKRAYTRAYFVDELF